MEQKQQKNPAQQAGQHQGNQPGKQGRAGQHQPGKQGQPGSNPNRNEEFPGKAPDVYSDRNKDRSENPDAARHGQQGSRHQNEDRSRSRQ